MVKGRLRRPERREGEAGSDEHEKHVMEELARLAVIKKCLFAIFKIY